MKNFNFFLIAILVLVTSAVSAQQDIILNIVQPPQFQVSANATDTTIFSGESVQLGYNLDVSGGSGNYTFSWTGGSVIENATSQNPEVSPDTTTVYTVTVLDENGCSADVQYSVEVLKPVGISATVENSANCFGGGSIEVEVFDGTPPYNISWSNGATSNKITDLTPGEYVLTVTDYTNQILTDTFEVVETNPLVTDFEIRDTIIGEVNHKVIDVTAAGGTPPYSYEWPENQSTEDVIVADSVQSYPVTVTDASGCSETFDINLTAINLTQKGNMFLIIFPNPSSGKFNFKINSDIPGKMEILITNIEGKQVLYKEVSNFSGYYSGEVNLPKVQGAYQFTAKTKTGLVTKKFVIH